MDIPINADTFFLFDLDDTLYAEADFLQSGYRHIAALLAPMAETDLYAAMMQRYLRHENVFRWIVETYQHALPELSIPWLLQQYHTHMPQLALPAPTRSFLQATGQLGIPAGLVTDGRSITQRNKIKALGLENYFTDVIISEEFGSAKPDARNYTWFVKKYRDRSFTFFGDNTAKDFIMPARLGWRTVCIADSGRHIHRQNLQQVPIPDIVIRSFDELRLIAPNRTMPDPVYRHP